MSVRLASSLLLGFLALSTVGCGASSVTPTVNAPIGSDEQLKKDLQVIAEHGTGESALEPIVMGVQALDPATPRKADLEKAKARLLKSPTAEKRKEVAREMIQMLDSPKAS